MISKLRADAVSNARSLLGATITRTLDSGETLSGVVIETEAYTGPEDQCSHAKNGRRTERNEHMWSQPGTAYVYFTYGMHCCFNIACYKKDHPAAVLIRALKPIEGLETMRTHRAARSTKAKILDRDLCSGPAKLCQSLDITLNMNGTDMLTSRSLTLSKGISFKDSQIEITPRIGVGSGEWAEKPLRWVVKPEHVRAV